MHLSPVRWLAILCFLFALSSPLAAHAADAAKIEAEGKAVVRDLLSRKPTEAVTNTGVLKLRLAGDKRTQVKVEQRIEIATNAWLNIYTAFSTNGTKLCTLTITHAEGKPNEFLLMEFDGGEVKQTKLAGTAAAVPFAGSDFWISDLGLEFFQWPTQRLLKKELRSSNLCWVIESVNPHPEKNDYSRVVSWIDIDTGGPLHVDAYDRGNKLLKEFEPKKFQKVDGKYELKEMEIRNNQRDTRTSIIFDVGGK